MTGEHRVAYKLEGDFLVVQVMGLYNSAQWGVVCELLAPWSSLALQFRFSNGGAAPAESSGEATQPKALFVTQMGLQDWSKKGKNRSSFLFLAPGAQL